jgi:hypothetical protein
MPELPLLIDAVRDYLIAEDVVRDPRTPGEAPPCWRSPRYGVPAPGEGEGDEVGPDVVVGLFPATGIAREPYDASVLRTDGLDVRIRSRTAPAGIRVDDAIREVLVDKRALQLVPELRVVEVRLERPLGLIVSDEQGYDYVAGYLIERAA